MIFRRSKDRPSLVKQGVIAARRSMGGGVSGGAESRAFGPSARIAIANIGKDQILFKPVGRICRTREGQTQIHMAER
jgi:hypothetical protein